MPRWLRGSPTASNAPVPRTHRGAFRGSSACTVEELGEATFLGVPDPISLQRAEIAGGAEWRPLVLFSWRRGAAAPRMILGALPNGALSFASQNGMEVLGTCDTITTYIKTKLRICFV